MTALQSIPITGTFMLGCNACIASNDGTFLISTEDSSVSFDGAQQGVGFAGSFSDFDGIVVLNTKQLEASSINAAVRIASVSTDNEDRDTLLLGTDWLNAQAWSTATFSSASISATGQGTYSATGALTLRNISRDVEFSFILDESTGAQKGPRMIGSIRVNRLDFEVGTGDWVDTDWVSDAVLIRIDLLLIPLLSSGSLETH